MLSCFCAFSLYTHTHSTIFTGNSKVILQESQKNSTVICGGSSVGRKAPVVFSPMDFSRNLCQKICDSCNKYRSCRENFNQNCCSRISAPSRKSINLVIEQIKWQHSHDVAGFRYFVEGWLEVLVLVLVLVFDDVTFPRRRGRWTGEQRAKGEGERCKERPRMRYRTRLCRGWREGSVQLLTGGGRRVSQPTATLFLAILKLHYSDPRWSIQL